MSINLKPLGNHLVVEPVEEAEITAFGIILPETAKEKPQRGVVLAIGPGRRLDNGQRQVMTVKEGDTVLYAKYGGTEIKLGMRNVMVLTEDDVLAIIG
jgi:chaperonin GroES